MDSDPLARVGPTPAYTGPPQLARSVAIDDLTHPVVMESSSYVGDAAERERSPLAAFPPVDKEGRREMDFFNREKREGPTTSPPWTISGSWRTTPKSTSAACLPGCLLINTFFIFLLSRLIFIIFNYSSYLKYLFKYVML
jgi:hypothetical protein